MSRITKEEEEGEKGRNGRTIVSCGVRAGGEEGRKERGKRECRNFGVK